MATFENVMTELYEILLHLRYPGIAQATPKDMENTILGCENRQFLLSWLLTQTPIVPSEEFATNTDEAKLVKWYTNMGICINSDALLGKVPMHDQISTLRNLLVFMKNVLIKDQSIPCEESSVINTLKKHIGENINIIPPTCSLTSKLNYNEAVNYLKTRKRSLDERRSQEFPDAMQNTDANAEIFGSHKETSAPSHELDEKVVEKFLEAFESISTWPRSKGDESAQALRNSMNSQLEKINSNMTVLKETLRSRKEISKFVIPDGLKKPEMPLDEIIEEIVIGLEEVNNLYAEK